MKRWKKVLLGLAVALLAVALALGGAVYMMFRGTKPIADGEVLAPGVWTIKDGIVSVFALETGDGGVALIDAGNDREGHALLAGLRAHGFAPDAVRAIFLTHGHPDHVAGAHLFPHAAVYAMATEVPLLEGRARARSFIGRVMPARDSGVRLTRALSDDDSVTVGTLEVHAFATPGHTDGSAVYVARGVVFFGDSADSSTDGTVRPAKTLFSNDPAQNVRSLDALAARLAAHASDVHVLAFAHSGSLQGLGPLTRFAQSH